MTAELAQIAAHAQALLATGRAAEAASSLQAVAAQFGERAEWHALHGTALRRSGDMTAAVQAFERACAAAPRNPDFAVGLGLCHRQRKDDAQALLAYRRALELNPDHAIAHCNLGNVLFDGADYEQAITHHQRAIELDPRLTAAWIDLAKSLEAIARLRDADPNYLAGLRRFAVHSAGGNPLRLFQLGAIYLHLGWLDKATEFIEQARAALPDDPQVEFCLAVIRLSQGDHASGWSLFESRLRCADQRIPDEFPDIRSPRLEALPASADQRILVLPEQGYGDRIQFSRYLPLLGTRYARACYVVDAAMLTLMQASGIDAHAQDAPLPAHDAHCFIMSLPHLFGTVEDTIPAPPAYLAPPAAAREHWRHRLVADTRLRVGLNWAGNPQHRQDRYRSLSLDVLAPLLKLPNVSYYSVQKYTGDEPEQRARLAALGIADLSSDIADFGDAAGLMANLDLIIAVDTASAHLAGALGHEVWTLLPSVPDYRWATAGTNSAWYPSMRLFRQQQAMQWAPVIAEVRQALLARAAQGR